MKYAKGFLLLLIYAVYLNKESKYKVKFTLLGLTFIALMNFI